MIRYKVGNILQSDSEALVNTVNIVGVMGKGIAYAFKKAYPKNFQEYEKASRKGFIEIGKMFVTETGLLQPRLIINFPTKKHWRYPSQMSFIEKGLDDLVNIIIEYQIKSISIPPLGCGNGKLHWDEVKPLIEDKLLPLADKIDITVFEPGYNDQIEFNRHIELTAGRAMLYYSLYKYQNLGYEINLLVIQKICYFLQRLGEDLSLRYEKGHYGPYAHNLNHLLQNINGSLIKYDVNSNKPTTIVKLNDKRLSEVKDYISLSFSEKQKVSMKKLIDFIEGFESPYGLELLATVDFIKQNNLNIELPELILKVNDWTERKRLLLKDYHLKIAYHHVDELN